MSSGPSVGDVFRKEVIEWRGRKLVLARASYESESIYRYYLETEARKLINRHRGNLDAPMDMVEYKAQLAVWQEGNTAKVYDAGTPAWVKSLESRENVCRFFYIVFTQPGIDGKSPEYSLTLPEMDELWKEKREEISDAWERIQGAGTDPPVPARVLPAPAA